MKIPLSAPDITEVEKQMVMEVVSGKNLSMGPMLKRFEKEFAAYIGVKHAIAVNSGTSGLHLLVRALNLKFDDEVITTPFSFIASTNCLLYEGVYPVFADIDDKTMNIDVNLLENLITSRTKAILPVHVFGYPLQMNNFKKISEKYGLKVIEDACEALGSEFAGQKAGTLGDGAVFAFYPNKQITTGEGGMIVTNNDEIAAKCQSMRNQGRSDNGEWLCHERLGYNYRLDEMSAAMGLGQLKRIEEILAKRNRVASLYIDKLKNVDGICLPPCQKNDLLDIKISWFVFVIRLDSSIDRNQVLKLLNAAGIESKTYFSPIHLQPFYRNEFGYQRGDYPITEKVSDSTLALPFHNNLTE